MISLFKKTEFVPVVMNDTRSRSDKWKDDRYLIDLETVGNNAVYISEVLRELTFVRDAADNAKTPDFLHGCNVGISALKRLLSVAARAKAIQQKNIRFEEMQDDV